MKVYEGFGSGRKEWVSEPAANIEKTIRLWPHQLKGEGHYIAVLRKIDGEEPVKRKYPETFKKLFRVCKREPEGSANGGVRLIWRSIVSGS